MLHFDRLLDEWSLCLQFHIIDTLLLVKHCGVHLHKRQFIVFGWCCAIYGRKKCFLHFYCGYFWEKVYRMDWCSIFHLAAVIVLIDGGGVTKSSGITKFWTDDYKVFDQIYGKTSDRELYSSGLPSSISYGIDASKLKKNGALKLLNRQPIADDIDTTASDTQVDPYGYGNDFSQLRDTIKYGKELIKPIKTSNKLMYSLYKPIREDTDPETFDYFKHLEQLGKQELVEFPMKGIGGFQPYMSSFKPNTGLDSYKSIQDILDAQDVQVNQKTKYGEEDDVKYMNYHPVQSSRSKNQIIRLIQSNNLSGSRCGTKGHGRCRKRSYSRIRSRSRPIVRKVKHTIISD